MKTKIVATYTLFDKEFTRFLRVWLQTIVAPVVTSLLYLLVFGQVFAKRIEVFEGIEYGTFLIPGLIMMTAIQNAFANTSSSIIQSKVMGNMVFVLLSPVSSQQIFIAYVAAAVVRGLVISLIIFAAVRIFMPVPIEYPLIALAFAILGCYVMAVLGIVAGIWAEKFDQIAAFQSFIIVPLTFLSGVFYSIHALPELWFALSKWNPFFYMIDGFRFGFFGQSDASITSSLMALLIAAAVMTVFCLFLLRSGYKLRDA